MRISSDRDDPGYMTWVLHGWRRVLLNGIELRYVVTADDETGEVTRLAQNDKGEFIIENDEVRRETLRGKVEFKR